jgi:periplasmic divalent cation tolerance protein
MYLADMMVLSPFPAPEFGKSGPAPQKFNNSWTCTRMISDIGALIVITTVPDENLAVKITESLLQQRLAACVHALPTGWSRYRWQGKIETSAEITLLIKCIASRYTEIEADIKRLHPYDLPEIVALPITIGLPAYLNWILNETN